MDLKRRRILKSIFGYGFAIAFLPLLGPRKELVAESGPIEVSNKIFFKPEGSYKDFLMDLSNWLDQEAYSQLTQNHLNSGQFFRIDVKETFVETKFSFRDQKSCDEFFSNFYQIANIDTRAKLGYRFEREVVRSNSQLFA